MSSAGYVIFFLFSFLFSSEMKQGYRSLSFLRICIRLYHSKLRVLRTSDVRVDVGASLFCLVFVLKSYGRMCICLLGAVCVPLERTRD